MDWGWSGEIFMFGSGLMMGRKLLSHVLSSTIYWFPQVASKITRHILSKQKGPERDVSQ